MGSYLSLPIMITLSALLTYVLLHDRRSLPARLFALYIGSALLMNVVGLVRVTTVDPALAEFAAGATAPVIAANASLQAALLMALFIPHRFAQARVTLPIAAAYALVSLALLADWLLGLRWVHVGVAPEPGGGFRALRGEQAGIFVMLSLCGQLFPIILTAVVAWREPRRRGVALLLCAAQITSILVSAGSVQIGLPTFSYVGPLPMYIAFGWMVLRYGLFRPSSLALETAIERLPDGVAILDGERVVRYANRPARAWLGADPAHPLPLADLLAAAGLAPTTTGDDSGAGRERLMRHGADELVLDVAEAPVEGDAVAASVVLLRDITAAERRDRALAESSAALARRGAELEATLREVRRRDEVIADLSLPLIPIAEGVLVLPLIGAFDAERSPAVIGRLLREIEESRARTVLLDMTGVTAFDESLALALRKAIGGARLMGAHLALCGVRPDLAEAMVHEQVRLDGVRVYASLQEGVAAAR